MALSFDKRQAITGFEGEDPNASAAMDALKGYGAKFIRDMNPFRTGQPAQPQGQQAAQTQQPSAVGQTPAPSPQPQSEAMQALTRSPNADTPGQQAVRENSGPVNLQPSNIKQALVNDPRNVRVDNGTVPAGMSRTYNDDGTVTYTMGNPGQDGYGRMTVIPGSGRPQQQDQSIKQRLVSGPMTNATTVQGANGPYSVSGDPAAVAAFSRPVAPAVGWDGNTSSGEKPAYQQVRARSETAARLATIPPPEYSTDPNLGWQAKRDKYQEDVKSYNNATGQQTQLDLEAMRQAGAGVQSLADAKRFNDANAIDQKRLGLEQQRLQSGQPLLDAQAKTEQAKASQITEENNIRKQLATIPPGSPAYVEAERRLATLSGRYGEQKQQNIKEVDELIDPTKPALGTRKALVKVNPDGTYNKMQEAGGSNQQGKTPVMLPEDQSKRVVGQEYTSSSGKKAVWDGKGLVLSPQR